MRDGTEVEQLVRELYGDDPRAGAAIVYLTHAFLADWVHARDLTPPGEEETPDDLTERIIQEVDRARPHDSAYTFETAVREADHMFGKAAS